MAADRFNTLSQRQAAAREVPLAPAGKWALRLPGERSVLVDRRSLFANLVLAALLLLTCGLSLSLGSVNLTPLQGLQTLFGEGDPLTTFMVLELRLPRLLAGLATGAAFAQAGCLMQTLARNRLATPGIIGIDNGATAFAIASVLGVGVSMAPSAMALVGAATAAALAFGLAGDVGTRGYRFIVAGIGIGAVFGALTQLMMAQVAIDAANAAYPWTVGTLNARPAGAVAVLGIALALSTVAALLLARSLTVLRFSDAVAQGLGIRVRACRYASLALAIVMAGLAVAVAGPVGLVGLVGPEVARYVTKDGVPVIGASLAGALVMVLSDLAGRLLLAPLEVPVGIITAVVGGPYLLWILLRSPRIAP